MPSSSTNDNKGLIGFLLYAEGWALTALLNKLSIFLVVSPEFPVTVLDVSTFTQPKAVPLLLTANTLLASLVE